MPVCMALSRNPSTDRFSNVHIDARDWRDTLRHFNVTPTAVRRIRRGRNIHWVVRTATAPVVLRRYASDCTPAGVAYELAVLAHLGERGWPVPPLLAPAVVSHCGIWCLFGYLGGRRRSLRSAAGRRTDDVLRGRLLAELHADLADIKHLGQRDGWRTTPEGLFDRTGKQPANDVLQEYASRDPETGRLLLEYLDEATKRLSELMPEAPEPIVIHGDFTPWNLRFAAGRLSGVLDFDITHLDLRVADFALSWRGRYDGVLEGYEQVSPLSDIERELLIPVYWAWMIAVALWSIEEGNGDPEWAVAHLVRQPFNSGA